MYSKKCLLLSLSVAGLLACPADKTEAGGNRGESATSHVGIGDYGDKVVAGGKDSGGSGWKKGGASEIQVKWNLENWGLGAGGGVNVPNIVAEGVKADASKSLILGHSLQHMWLTDSANDMVSKIDMRTGRELARYRSVSARECKAGQSAAECEVSRPVISGNYYPSSTATDHEGNLWVANRGGGANDTSYRPGMVTKIAADESFCIDRNGNGQIDTSRDLNGNGIIEDDEMVEDDECVLFSTRLCTGSALHEGTRALAISGGAEGTAGDVWAGCYQNKTVYKLNSTNGVLVQGPIHLGMKPHGAIVDGHQNLWLASEAANLTEAYLQGIDTQTGNILFKNHLGNAEGMQPPGVIGACGFDGMALDSKDRLWFSGYGQPNIAACFYNPYVADNKWRRCLLAEENFNSGRGIAVDVHDNVYMSSGTTGRLARFRWDDQREVCEFVPMRGPGSSGNATLNTVHLGIGDTLTGVDFDAGGNPWVVALGSEVARLDLGTGEISRMQHATESHTPRYHSYSNFIGYQQKPFRAPIGSYMQTLEGCPKHSSWKSVSWDAIVPVNTQLEVYVQVDNTREELSSSQRYGPFSVSPANLSGVPKSSFMLLEFILISEDGKSSPRIHNYGMEWACEPVSG
ncbi:MAG: hypothetical protein FWD46_06980 [Cystobacterineae bacterium]|nr:hypothetical protein [Cystobacterineae bacterium]